MIEKVIQSLSDVFVENEVLHIYFEAISENAKYDVCSMGGRIILHGKLSQKLENRIDLKGQLPGHYRLYILDAGKIHRTTFKL